MQIDDEREEISEMLRKAAASLSEHLEAVQILASRTIDGQTETYAQGAGNWHARVGMADLFIKTDQPSTWTKPGDEESTY